MATGEKTLPEMGPLGAVADANLICGYQTDLGYFTGTQIKDYINANAQLASTAQVTGLDAALSAKAAALTVVYLVADYTIQTTDNNKLFICTVPLTITVNSVLTYANNFTFAVKNFVNDTYAPVIVDAADPIDYLSSNSLELQSNQSVVLTYASSGWAIQDSANYLATNAINTASNSITLSAQYNNQLVALSSSGTAKTVTLPDNLTQDIPPGFMTWIYNPSSTANATVTTTETLEGDTIIRPYGMALIYKRVYGVPNTWVCFAPLVSSSFGTAAYKAASDNSKAVLASINGPITSGHVATFADGAGTIQDGGALGTAAFKSASNPGYNVLASITTMTTAGHLATFNDIVGSLTDGGVAGTAANKAASNNALPTVSSVSGSTTSGHLATFADTAGTVQDGGAITQFLQSANNLSDLASLVTSRFNLSTDYSYDNTSCVGITTNVTLTNPLATFIEVVCVNPGLTITLPAMNAANGMGRSGAGRFFCFRVTAASNSFTLAANSGTSIGTIYPGEFIFCWVRDGSADGSIFYSVSNGTVSPLGVIRGGTGSTTASGARTNLGLGTIATQNATDLQFYKVISSKTGAYTLVGTDDNAIISCSGTFTLSVTAAATLTSGWHCEIRNTGTGVITIDPNGSETIDGQSTALVLPGQTVEINSDGSNLFTTNYISNSRCRFVQTATVTLASSAVETTLVGAGRGSMVIPANMLIDGRAFVLEASGIISTKSGLAPTTAITFKAKLGSTVLSTTGSVAMNVDYTNMYWKLKTIITCRTTGASGTTFSQGEFDYNTADSGASPVRAAMKSTAAVTVDTTAQATFDFTAQWSVSNASNSISCTDLTLHVLN